MLWRSNQGKDKSDKPVKNNRAQVENNLENTMSKEEFIQHNKEAQRVLADIEKLRTSVENFKQTGVGSIPTEISNAKEKTSLEDSEEVKAAKQVILEQAKKDALEKRAQQVEAIRREKEARLQEQRVLEAQRRAALIEEEAERKRRQAEEAERAVKEMARRTALESMEAERKAKEAAAQQALLKQREEAVRQAEIQRATIEKAKEDAQKQTLRQAQQTLYNQEKKLSLMTATPEELAEFFEEKEDSRVERLLKEQQEMALRKQKLQEERDAKLAKAQAEKAEKMAKLQAEKAQKLAKLQAEKAARNAKLQAEREAKAARLKAEKEARITRLQAEKEARIARAMAEREAKISKAMAEKEERRIREEKRKLERLRKAEERDLIKRAKRDAEARAQLEKMRLEAKSKADAELGGGIVNVQGMTINTEIKEVVHFRLRDVFNIRTKKERQAESESEKKKLAKERRRRTEEARRLIDLSIRTAHDLYQRTAFARGMKKFYGFCERHKVGILTISSIVLLLIVGSAGVLNHYTAYAYSYNGKDLGVVKQKDDVLQITDLVQGALTEDKSMDVIIDAKDDIEFERIWTGNDVELDSSEEVLKRLTYMGQLNVKAQCVFIDGKKVGAVEDKQTAAEVLQEIKNKYSSGREGAEIEEAVFIEKVEVKKANIDLENVYNKDEMVELLCANREKESLHEVKPDESLEEIAKLYSMTEKEILKDNPNVNKKNITVGTKLVIKKKAPILTVKITEKLTYEKVIEHEVKKKDSKDIYEGYTETEQAGADGLSEVTSRIIMVNGQQVDEIPLVTTVIKKPITEVILVGIKDRPPSVGSGKFIWPMEQGVFQLSSLFGPRWGGMHYGIDMAGPTGNKIFAADGGVVKSSGWSGGYGYLIVIDHQNGMETRYAHNSQLLVKEGDKVFQGQEIAKSGNSGNSTGPHLHFEIRVGGVAKNPLNYLP